MKNILITGITGQDGLFLTSKLLKMDVPIKITGISRQYNLDTFYSNLKSLGNKDFSSLQILNIDLLKYDDIFKFISEVKPDEIYNFSGPSSVYDSILNPSISKYQIITIFDNLINACIESKNLVSFFQASSSEIYSSSSDVPIDEETEPMTNSPYAEAKLANHLKIQKLNEDFNWNIISGIMFNHESEFRGKKYLISKIINSARNIKEHKETELVIGSLEYIRDWSFAGDIVNSIYELMRLKSSGAYVIGSGVGNSIETLVNLVFSYFDLEYTEYVKIDDTLLRKGDPIVKIANPKKLKDLSKLETYLSFDNLIVRCIEKTC
jgi:GDPmannose 4,6-dehydratase